MPARRIHGQYFRLLCTTTHTGTFSILGAIDEVVLHRSASRADASCFGDTNEVSLKGLPTADIDIKGLYDIDDTVMTAARLLTDGAMLGLYPDYIADKATYYAVLVDLDFDYSTSIKDNQKIDGKAFARGAAIDNL